MTIGYDSAKRWLFNSARQLERIEYLSLLAIALIIVWWGFLPGVSIGVIFGCATFALSAGRISVVKLAFDGSEYRSSLDRGPQELALLGAHGRELQGLRLQSYLFFGSANRLYEQVKVLLAERPECRFLLFDFRLVTGLDSSAVHSFTQIKEAAEVLGAQLVLVHLTPSIEKAFGDNQVISKTSWSFRRSIARSNSARTPSLPPIATPTAARARCTNGSPTRSATPNSPTSWLKIANARSSSPATSSRARANRPIPCTSYRWPHGNHDQPGRRQRDPVRSLGRHTTIGEMGLLTGRPRSATVQAEVASVAYELRADAFERLKVEHPALVQALLTYVISLMAERLSFASRVIGVLQR